MNPIGRRTSHANGPADQDLDGLLHSYFRSRMPEPWPELALPPSRSIPLGVPARSGWRGRLSLAASIAALFLGQMWLFGSFHSVAEPVPADRVIDVAHRPSVPGADSAPDGPWGSGTDSMNAVPNRLRLKNMR